VRGWVGRFSESTTRTRVSLCWQPDGNVTDSELQEFLNARAGMSLGWTGSFDKLDALVASNAHLISAPEITATPQGPVAFIHLSIAKKEIQNAMGPAIGEVFSAVAAQGGQVAGPWFALHHAITADAWDFDVCVPTASQIQATGRVEAKTLTATRAASAVYTGPYESLHKAWSALRFWMDAKALKRQPWLCEVYEVGPESKPLPAQWKTRLFQPLVE
jgi:effector-binding domain-containing protein